MVAMTGGRARRRVRSERGVSLVSYALVLSLLVVGSVGAIGALQSSAGSEVDNQAMCVSTRPPPPSCLPAAVVPAPPTSTGGGSGPAPGPAPDQMAAPSYGTPIVSTKPLTVQLPVTIVDGNGDPLEGRLVRVDVSYELGRRRVDRGISCTTDAAGRCTIDWQASADTVKEATLEIVSVSGDAPMPFKDGTPPPVTVTEDDAGSPKGAAGGKAGDDDDDDEDDDDEGGGKR